MTSAKYHAGSNSQTGLLLSPTRRQRLLLAIVLIALAASVRLLTWQDNHDEVHQVETFVTSDYKDSARQLLNGDLRAFVSDINHMEHPPGYSILLGAIFKAFGYSDKAIQFTQIIADCAAVILVFLFAGELFTTSVATLAGILVALSPQLAYYSILLLPDSICILPILAAMLVLLYGIKQKRFWWFALAGALIGVSCWLRANALLLAPFVACALPLWLKKGERLSPAAALILGTLITIAPVTLKNAIVFHRFVPLSLGAGQKLLEGIAEFDSGSLGVPKTDYGIMLQEAAIFNRPDYAQLLFGPDGIERDRQRVQRGVRIIAAHPVWYAGVMSRRALSFFRFARVPLIARDVPVTHDLAPMSSATWFSEPANLLSGGRAAQNAKASETDDKQAVRLSSDESKYGSQFLSAPIATTPHHDYLLRLPIKLEDGRIAVNILDNRSRILSRKTVDLLEIAPGSNQPRTDASLSFIAGSNSQVHLSIENNAPESSHSIVEFGRVELFDLGPSSQEWIRFVRLPLRWLQAPFISAVIIPFVLLGTAVLLWQRQFRNLALLLVVPTYFVVFQSPLHTERRYVAAIQYFLLILVAVGLTVTFRALRRWISRRPSEPASVQSTHSPIRRVRPTSHCELRFGARVIVHHLFRGALHLRA